MDWVSSLQWVLIPGTHSIAILAKLSSNNWPTRLSSWVSINTVTNIWILMIAGWLITDLQMAKCRLMKISHQEWKTWVNTSMTRDFSSVSTPLRESSLAKEDKVACTTRRRTRRPLPTGKSTTSSMITASLRTVQRSKDIPQWETLSTRRADKFTIPFALREKKISANGLLKLLTRLEPTGTSMLLLIEWIYCSKLTSSILKLLVLADGTILTCWRLAC